LRRCAVERRRRWQTTGCAKGRAQNEFHLCIQAAQVVVRPPLHRLEDGSVGANEEGLAFGHEAPDAYW